MATKYKSIAEIEAEFNAKLAAADDGDRSEIRAEMAEAKASFYESAAASAQRSAWVSNALATHPELRDFPELVAGESEDEIKASAAKAAERIGALRGPAAPLATPRPDYGDPAAGVGGGAPIVHSDEAQKRERRIYDKLAVGDRVPQADFAQWLPGRLREARRQARQAPSYGGGDLEPPTTSR